MEHLAEYILASSIVLLALLVLIGLMANVFAWRASKKKTTGAQKLQENLAPGQLVVLADGIYGKVVRVGKETVDIEFKSGVAEVARYAVVRVIA